VHIAFEVSFEYIARLRLIVESKIIFQVIAYKPQSVHGFVFLPWLIVVSIIVRSLDKLCQSEVYQIDCRGQLCLYVIVESTLKAIKRACEWLIVE
jgi:hypothetical protein